MQLCILIKLLIFSYILLFSNNIFANDIRFVHPTDGYLSTSPKIHIILLSKINNPITIKVNQKNYKTSNPKILKNKDGVFYVHIFSVLLDNGKNELMASYDKYTSKINIQYRKTAETYKSNIKKATFFHQSESSELCKMCHNYDNIKDCSTCHANKLKNKFVHGPVASMSCNQCHDKNNFFSLIQPITNKCFSCHDDFNKKFYNYKFVHGPVGAGLCTTCHDPHSSKNNMMLNDEINELCNNCHTDKRNGVHILRNFNTSIHPTSDKYITALKEPLSCASCHDPHYGNTKSLFRFGAKDFLTLCIKCHKDKL